MLASRLITVALIILFSVAAWTTNSFAGTKLYQGAWIAESFGNDKVGIGTEASQYFSADGIPLGANCHPNAPLCTFSETPVTTPGLAVFNPLGPGCRPLTVGEKPRPAKGGTLTSRVPPLYRNNARFTSLGAASNQACAGDQTVGLAKATAYLPPGDPQRGIVMKGNPVSGSGSATTTGTSLAPGTAFNFPAALATPGPGNGMRRTTQGSFIGEGPYLYSYSYAQLRNDVGSFGPGNGFFSTAATPSTLSFQNKAGGVVASAKVKAGTNRFGGVMQLLGTFTTKVCYFYGGGCALGYGDWAYELIGASGYKNTDTAKGPVGIVTKSSTTNFTFTYYNTGLGSVAKYTVVAQRFPWTTGTVTVTATGRGPHKTFAKRVGFDNRVSGVGTVQLVSPILTQWLGNQGAPSFETGGVAVMQIKFAPEAGGIASLVAGLSMLLVIRRFRR